MYTKLILGISIRAPLSAVPVFFSSHSRKNGNLGIRGRGVMGDIGTTGHEILIFTGMAALRVAEVYGVRNFIY